MRIHGMLLFVGLGLLTISLLHVQCRDPCCDIIDVLQEFIETFEQKPLEQALSDAIDLDIEIKKCDLEIANEFEKILKNIIEMMNGVSGFRPMRREMVKEIRNLLDNKLKRHNKRVMKATLFPFTHTPDLLTVGDRKKMKKALSGTRKYLGKVEKRHDTTALIKCGQDVLKSLTHAVKGNAKSSSGLKKLANKLPNLVNKVYECDWDRQNPCHSGPGVTKCPAGYQCTVDKFKEEYNLCCRYKDVPLPLRKRAIYFKARVMKRQAECPADCGPHGTRVSQGPFFSFCRCDSKWIGECCDQAHAIDCPPRVVKRQAPVAGCPAGCGPRGTLITLGPFFSFCRCDLMWEGRCCDVVQQFTNMVFCRAWGDVHMDSFDKQNIHFQDSCITDMVTTSAFPNFTVSLKGYFTSPTAIYSWIDYVRLVVTDGRGTTTKIVIKRKDTAGKHVVEWTDAGSPPFRIATFPYTKDVTYTHATGFPKTVRFKIYISGANVVVDVASTIATGIGLRIKSTATAYPSAYIYAANAWRGVQRPFGLEGMCGNFDGNMANNDDRRGRNGAVVTINPPQYYGTAMSNSWRANDNLGCINNKADGPWPSPGRRKRRIGTDLMELAKLYCRNADCDKQKDTNKWSACSLDASNPLPDDDLCLLLEEQIHSKSRCWEKEFDCPKVIRDAKKELKSR